MKEFSSCNWRRLAHYFFIRRFFSTLWTIIGLLILFTGLCLLPRTIRLIKNVRQETKQALRESHAALRETRKAIRDSYRVAKVLNGHLQEARELNQYLRQPFQVNIQLSGKSDWFDMKTEGNAVIVPQSKVPVEAAKPVAPDAPAKPISD